MMSKIVGIDLGTTSARVAVIDEIRCMPVVIENSEGEGTTPSYIAVTENGDRHVGEAARRYALHHPKDVAFAVKRLIGRRYDDRVVQEIKRFVPYKIVESDSGDAWIEICGRQFAPDQLSAFVLQKMRITAENYLGEKIEKAVITVPAYFNNAQIQSTKDAGKIAGLDIYRVIAEPTAAAISYGEVNKSAEEIMVFDLGGGTFDVSILQLGDGVYEVKSSRGDMFLGGENIDYCLVDYIVEGFKSRHGVNLLNDKIATQRLKQEAERIKIALSSAEQVRVELPFICNNGNKAIHLQDTITRRQYESLIADLVEQMIKICKDAVSDAELAAKRSAIRTGSEPTPVDIERIILVGGSSRIPLIQKALKEAFEVPLYGGLRREDAVALGAAVQAAVLQGTVKDVLLLDVKARCYGVELSDGSLETIIHSNSTIPTKISRELWLPVDFDGSVAVRIFQWDEKNVSEKDLISEFELRGMRPKPHNIDNIRITMDIDANGIVNVLATDIDTQKEVNVRVSVQGGLQDYQIERMLSDASDKGIAADIVRPVIETSFTPEYQEREEESEPPAEHASTKQSDDLVKPKVFVSYASEDLSWAAKIEKALGVLLRNGGIELWLDRRIETGDQWEEEIYSAIAASNIAMLILSNDFLNSDFIISKELPIIFAENESRRLTLYPIVVRPCAFEFHEDLRRFQTFNNPEQPLSSLHEWEVEQELVRLVRDVGVAAQ